jgi:hypothetical protein
MASRIRLAVDEPGLFRKLGEPKALRRRQHELLKPRRELSLPWNCPDEDAAQSDDTAKRQQEDTRAKPGFSFSTPSVRNGACHTRLSLSRKIAGCRNGLLVQLSD